MSREDHSEFWKAGLRRKPEEEDEWQACFMDQPEARARYEEELQLNHLLRDLPDVPVSSNFTALVMQAVNREEQQQPRSPVVRLWSDYLSLGWGRKLAFASGLLLLGFFSYQQHQESERRELARSLVRFSSVLPADGVIEDFRAINALRQTSLAQSDETDLLDALR